MLALPPEVPTLTSVVPLKILLELIPVSVLALPNRNAPVTLPEADTPVVPSKINGILFFPC
jgi:hypothetical protein